MLMGPLPVMNRTLEKTRPNNKNKIKGLLPTLMLFVGLLDVIVIFGSGEERRHSRYRAAENGKKGPS